MEYEPLRKKLRRAGTGQEDNFVPSYLPGTLAPGDTRENFERVTELRWHHGIEISGADCPPPFEQFSQLQLSSELATAVAELGYQLPTPVQMQAIPCVLAGRDAIVLAETGSGKTLAYALPLCSLLSLFPPVQPGEGPRALVAAPTRELAKQIHEYMDRLIRRVTPPLSASGPAPSHTPNSAYSTLLVCGGVPLKPLAATLHRGVDVVVATPGKLLHLQETKALSLDSVSYLVVDEADKFMQGPMQDDLRRIFLAATSSLRPRQTLLFSATLPDSLERLARSAVLNPLMIRVGAIGMTATNLQQDVTFMHSYQKPKKLLEALRRTESPPVLVFCNSVETVDKVVDLLRNEQFHALGLHSEKPQGVRFETMDCLKRGDVDVVVATDVASRGMDIPGISHVINYDVPHSIEDYVHRCGRTARLGAQGKATSFLTLECKIASELAELLTTLEQPLPPELANPKQFGKRVVRTELGDRSVE